MGRVVAQVWIHFSYDNGVVSMVTKFYRSCSHINWCTFCIHVRSLDIRYFGTDEATRLIVVMSRLPSMAWLSC
jgi:hypothetical protein